MQRRTTQRSVVGEVLGRVAGRTLWGLGRSGTNPGDPRCDGKPLGALGWESDTSGLVFERMALAAVRREVRGG